MASGSERWKYISLAKTTKATSRRTATKPYLKESYIKAKEANAKRRVETNNWMRQVESRMAYKRPTKK